MKRLVEAMNKFDEEQCRAKDKYDVDYLSISSVSIRAGNKYATVSCWYNEEPTYSEVCDTESRPQTVEEFEAFRYNYLVSVNELQRVVKDWKDAIDGE